MRVKITAYKGILCIETQEPFTQDEDFVPAEGDNPECTLMDTKGNLGVSQEALDLLKTVRPSRDAIGDLMWFPSHKDKFCFGWNGGPLSLKDPKRTEGDRDYKVRDGEYTLIPNDVPEGVKETIENQ